MTGERTRLASASGAALGPAAWAPSATLTFLFTDIEGSTSLWERHPDEMPTALAAHDRILRGAVEREGGRIIKTTGDGVMAVFGSAREGLAATLGAQRDLLHESWTSTGPLRVRMGLHVGEAEADDGGHDYHGPSVNRAARIMAAGHGGQALLSAAAAALVIDRLPEGASLHDLGEHRLKDLSRPERVYELRHPDLPAVDQPLRTEDAARFALPAEPSAFVGREAARAELASLLAEPDVRLLTLIGPGGVGKTRLALRAARDVEPSFEAGALLVDLSASREVSDVLVTISRALGMSDTSAGSQAEELSRTIGDQHLLLVLDNVEQVTSAAATLAGLLSACPRLHLLVTSREALRVRGERRFPVVPMALPPPSRRSVTATEVSAFEAVRLFVERAQAIKPDFEVTDANAAVLAEICRRLEGVPLAIELATARLRVFSLEVLRDRLDSQLRTLGGGARDLPERQQTLRATIEWSYRLLSAGEQRLLALLSCFAGASVEAVEDVSARLADQLSEVDPLDALGSLADKSLLRQVDGANGEARFTMLEAVREFAREAMQADADLAAAGPAAQAEHYRRWLVARIDGLARPGRAELLDELEFEVENLRLAWAWHVREADLDGLQAMLGGLRPLYDARGWYRGFCTLLEDALAVLERLPTASERVLEAATLQSDRARAMAAAEGFTDEVEVAFDRVLATIGSADLSGAYPILRSLANFHQFRGEEERSLPYARQILALGEAEDDAAMRISGHVLLGAAYGMSRHLADSLADLEAGADLVSTAPDTTAWHRLGPDPRVSCLTLLSLVRFWEGRLDTSLRRSAEAVAIARRGGHPSTLGYGLHHASLLHTMRGEPELARALAVESVELATEHDLHVWRAVGTVILGAAAVQLGAPDDGMGWIREGLERYRGLRTPPVFWPFMLEVTANACRHSGETEFGLASVDEAIAVQPRLVGPHLARAGLLATFDRRAAVTEYELALAMSLGWGAPTPALTAAVGLVRLEEGTAGGDASGVVEARREQVREILAGFTEGLDHPLLLEARSIASA